MNKRKDAKISPDKKEGFTINSRKEVDRDVERLRVQAAETGISPMMHHPFSLIANDIFFNSTIGKEAAVTFSVLSGALVQTFAYNFSLSLHGYISYEISILTDYTSQGKLIQMVFSLVLLVMFTVFVGMSKSFLRRKLHGSPESLYDDKTQAYMLQANNLYPGS